MQLTPKCFAVLFLGMVVSACSNELNVCMKFDNTEPTSVEYKMCGTQTKLSLNEYGLWQNINPINVCEGLGEIEFLEGGVTHTLDTPYVPSSNVVDYLTVSGDSAVVRVDLITSEFGRAEWSDYCTMEKFK